MSMSPLLLAPALALGVIATARGVAAPMAGHHPALATASVQPLLQALPAAPQQAPPPSAHHGSAQSYCTSTINSTGAAATMSYSGSLSVCLNDTGLIADGVPKNSVGLFFYGGQTAQIPTANGYLCVSPFYAGLFRIQPSVIAKSNQRAEVQLDLHGLSQAGAITAGSTWYFQYWFRDPQAGGAGSNFSDGLRITFCH